MYHILRICKAPLIELAIQRSCQRGNPKDLRMSSANKRKKEGGSPVTILLQIAGGRPFHIEGPIRAKARCWASAVLVQGTSRSRRSADRRGREEREEIQIGFCTRSQRYFWSKTMLNLCNQEQYFVLNARGNRNPAQDIGHVG